MQESEESSQLTQNDQISELKKQISLHSALLVDIVSDDDKFIDKIKELNESGIACLLKENYCESSVYLQEAEKILQFAANCGKTIDRIIIILTLQNQACVYQRLWQLEKASSYLEAIIYNLNSFLEYAPEAVIGSDYLNSFSPTYSNLSSFINKKVSIVMYYLKFSAVNSQMKKHDTALNSAFKALSMIKAVCQECYNYERYLHKHQQPIELKTLLKELSCIKDSVDLDRANKYFKLAQKGIKKMKTKKLPDISKKDQEDLVNFSIGEVMQVSQISLHQLEYLPTLEEQISYRKKIYKVLYISICFFTIATQLRLLSEENVIEENRKNSSEYLRSKLFHLNSIIIACKYLPQENKYLEHIVRSFTNHYQIDLNQDSDLSKEDEFEGDQQNLIVHVKKQFEILSPQTSDSSKYMKSMRKDVFKGNQKENEAVRTPIPYQVHQKKKLTKKEKSKTKCRSIEKKSGEKSQNQIYLKHNYFQTTKRRKSSLNRQKMKVKLSPMVCRPKDKSKQRTHKSRSKDKNKSFNKKEQSCEKKSTDKKKKKTTKLQEQYFMKVNTKKKITSPKPLSLRIKVSDYMVNSTPRTQQQQISLKASGSKTPKPLKN